MNGVVVLFLQFAMVLSALLIVAGIVSQRLTLVFLGILLFVVVRILIRPEGKRRQQEEKATRAARISEVMERVRSGQGPGYWSERLYPGNACPNCGLKRVLSVTETGKTLLRTSHPQHSNSSEFYKNYEQVKCRNCGFHVEQTWESREDLPW